MNGISGETAGCDLLVFEETVGHSDPYIANVRVRGQG